jgi:hypothetical protein
VIQEVILHDAQATFGNIQASQLCTKETRCNIFTINRLKSYGPHRGERSLTTYFQRIVVSSHVEQATTVFTLLPRRASGSGTGTNYRTCKLITRIV